MIISVTCIECVKKYSTNIPQEAWNQYQDGIPEDIAFHEVSENARVLVTEKLCPTCKKKETE